MDSARPPRCFWSVGSTSLRLAILGKTDSRRRPRFAEKRMFVEYLRHGRFGRRLSGAAWGDRSPAACSDRQWFSAPDLNQIYREIEPIDFSKDVLSGAPERLLVLRDGPSGWTDFGSPQRAMDVLHGLSVLSRV